MNAVHTQAMHIISVADQILRSKCTRNETQKINGNVEDIIEYFLRILKNIKGTMSRASLQKFKISNRKPTNTSPDLITPQLQCQCNKTEKSSIFAIPPGAQDPNLKKSARVFQVLPP